MSTVPTLTDEVGNVLTLRELSQFASLGEVDTVPAGLEPEPRQIEVILKAKSIVNIRMSYGTNKLVLFHPTPATRKAVAAYEGYDVALVLDDTNGVFTPNTPQTIVDSVYEAGNDTMIVDTRNQS